MVPHSAWSCPKIETTGTARRGLNLQIHGGGFVTGVVFHPAEQDVIYSRTDVGGVFRWGEAANGWIPLNDDLGMDDSQLTGVISLAVGPTLGEAPCKVANVLADPQIGHERRHRCRVG